MLQYWFISIIITIFFTSPGWLLAILILGEKYAKWRKERKMKKIRALAEDIKKVEEANPPLQIMK
jgi:hypothetical protein